MYGEKVVARYDPPPPEILSAGSSPPRHSQKLVTTVDGLNFVGYLFSWFSNRVRSTNSSTHELVIFCILKENTMATKFEPHECVNFVKSTEKWYPLNQNHPQYGNTVLADLSFQQYRYDKTLFLTGLFALHISQAK